MFIINIFYVWFCISSHQPPFWLVITGSYLWLLHFLLSQLPSEPVYHPVLCGQVHLCSQQCCTCTLLPLHYKRSDLILEAGTIRHTFQNMWMWRWSLTGLWVCVQEMCCWVPFFWPWPRISPSTLSACVLQHCSILCRYWWLPPPAHHIVPFDFSSACVCGFFLHSVSTSLSTTDEPVSGGSSRSTPSSIWAASSSSLASRFSCLAHGTTCSLSTASCEWMFVCSLLSFYSLTAFSTFFLTIFMF